MLRKASIDPLEAGSCAVEEPELPEWGASAWRTGAGRKNEASFACGGTAEFPPVAARAAVAGGAAVATASEAIGATDGVGGWGDRVSFKEFSDAAS
jgi:hypothetical protein